MRIGNTQYGHARALICMHSKHEVGLHARLAAHAMSVGFMPPPDYIYLVPIQITLVAREWMSTIKPDGCPP